MDNITITYSEYWREVTEENNGHDLVPCEDNFQYTSTLVYDGVDAHGPFDYYLGEIISYTRILEYDNGIVHTNVLINHDLAYTPSPYLSYSDWPTLGGLMAVRV